ncbi:ABC transporter ATP-binding protein [Pseudooceanicola sediminis]|uniref:ABC transporter ATP-binding protein n=1 Tax=Pseudooceanicola sediminis TaxID=2211117 RepID=A0A399JAH0_9RHOB|nr:ABC transporter ATP-binding protein [Pseudooceanicola sediminis]KAA2317292.1 ABC transporter ATP-binding protein [Puniceibacterium sp. HSS470]RII39646.1 ABC transporter ATP-binding protein [Pseudooceanicola sediminis]|tara:strand:+ start:25118 stop:26200 length:1083 start_codon:yes stop_codon:yes gene_type:complete
MTEVSLRSLQKLYGKTAALKAISLDVTHGEFVSLLGPSGCGKSTTLKCIAGFEDITDGRICFDNKDISRKLPEDRDIGMVFQSYALFPHMTVTQNLAFGLEMRRVPKADIARRVASAMEMVQLTPYADRYPKALSGGQQQRVALARALVIEPAILLLDEPLANLDAKLRDEMRGFIRDLQKRVGITTIYVTHDQNEAMTMSDRVVVMFDGEIAQAAAPEDVYNRPASERVARFVGNANILDLPVAGADAQGTTVTLPGGTPLHIAPCAAPARAGAPDRLRVMARPEQITLTGPGLGQLPGRIEKRYFSGGHVEYTVATECGALFVTGPTTQHVSEGDTVGLSFDPARLWPLPDPAPERAQ